MNNKISVLILAKNEEDNIADCIKSCQKFAREIIVIDDYSNDNTAKIAGELGAKVIQHSLNGDWGSQQNFAINQANCDWIFFLDADERVDNALDEMPMNFELRHFLTDHRAEVTGMLLKEYDEAKTMQMLKEEGREEGREEGLAEGTVKGMLETLNNLVQAGHITQEIAAKQAGLTEEEFNNRVKQLLD